MRTNTSLFLPLLTLAALPCSAAPSQAPAKAAAPALLTLTQNGRSTYSIVIAADALSAEKTAANQLSQYLEKISGARLAVKAEGAISATAPQILVGQTRRVKVLLPKQNWATLGTDGIVIKTVGKNLILAGGQPRGTIYAVSSFLEDTLGVRRWTPNEETVPQRRTVQVSAQNTVYVPQFRTRGALYASADQTNETFPTYLKLNGHFQKQGPELGGHNSILGWCHTFMQLLPLEKYFKAHPEWYSDPANGNKPCTASSPMPAEHVWQLNLTNEEARKELTKNALEWIRKNPEAGTISISQNDNSQECITPAEQAIVEREGSPAGPILEFVNKVAADIEKEFPDFLVETLAYQYTRKPPKFIRPRKNVVVRLCSIEADFSRPLDSEANKAFRDDLLGWKAIAPRLYVWDYVTNFHNVALPHANLRMLGGNIKFFAANNVINLFEQGDAYTIGTGDFVALRIWLIAHMMWNPARDPKQLEAEFLNGYYGAAAPHLRAYLDTVQGALAKTGAALPTHQGDNSYLNLDAMNAMTRHFDSAAEAVASDSVLAGRVRRERMALDMVWILRYKSLAREAARRKVAMLQTQDLATLTADYVRRGREYKISDIAPGTWFSTFAEGLLAATKPIPALPPAIKTDANSDIVDVQDANFTLYNQGASSSLVDDALASDKRAARLVTNSNGWNAQYALKAEDSEFLNYGKIRAYAVVRIETAAGAAPTGPAFTCGIYDGGSKETLVELSKSAEDGADGTYKVYDLGAYNLNKNCYFWFAPARNANVANIYIDRIVMVREAD